MSTPANAWGSTAPDTDVTERELVGGPEGPEFVDLEVEGMSVPLGPELHVDGSGLEPAVLERAAALGLAREVLRAQHTGVLGIEGRPPAGELIVLADWLLTGHDDPRNTALVHDEGAQ